MQPLIRLQNVDVAVAGKLILQKIHWELCSGQNWAIVGRNGSGKSTFLKLVRGEIWPLPSCGKRSYFFDGREQTETAIGVKDRFSAVSPELQERYLQQDSRLTAREVVFSGFANTDYVYSTPTAAQRAAAQAIVQLLGIEELLRRNVQQLSTGELRKVLIARALTGHPLVLILDEVCDGLDVGSRETLRATIQRVAQSGTQVLYATHREEELIPAITNVLELQDGRILSSTVAEKSRPINLSEVLPTANRTPAAQGAGRLIIQIDGANVYLGRKRVLRNIDWQMHENEHWAVVGANGAGKSTFLKLVVGDLHPAAGGVVRRWDFDRTNTLWDIRRRVGFLSPELQANHTTKVRAEEVVASGFFGSVGLPKKSTAQQRQRARRLMGHFGATHLAQRRVGELSYGEFRKILLLRALVHGPQLLVCDEPFDGLDAHSRRDFCSALEAVARNGTQLLIVTHHVNELPRCITHTLLLDKGRITRVVGASPLKTSQPARRGKTAGPAQAPIDRLHLLRDLQA
jgi:molybdate transport system ATP-binding protein